MFDDHDNHNHFADGFDMADLNILPTDSLLSQNPSSDGMSISVDDDCFHWDEDTPRKQLRMRNWPPLPSTLPPPLPNALAMDNWPPVSGVRPPPLPGTANMDNWPPLPSTLPPPLP